MTLEQKKAIIDGLDVVAKILIAAVAGWWVFHTYPESREKDFRKSYWDHQMAFFFDASQAASRIATLPAGDPEKSKAINKFWELYWGPMVIVEAKCEKCDVVAQAMIQFGACLPEPGASKPRDDCSHRDFKNRSWELGKACRDLIGTSWDEKLEFLSEPCPPEGQPCRSGQEKK